MRAVFWLLTLFALATALALFATNNDAVLSVYWPPRYALDISLNLALLALAALAVVGYIVLRSTFTLQQLPRQARQWRQHHQERHVQHHLLQALSAYHAGRYTRARTFARQALHIDAQLYGNADDALPTNSTAPRTAARDPHHTPPPYRQHLRAFLHYIMAESSHAMKDVPQRDAHRDQALQLAASKHTPAEMREGVQLRAIRWALDDRETESAMQRIDALPHGAARRIAALRLRLKAARLLGLTAVALDTARALARHGAYSTQAGPVLLARLQLDHIDAIEDTSALLTLWKKMDATERAQPAIALSMATRLQQLGGCAAQARDWLLPVWQHFAQHPPSLPVAQQQQLVQALEQSMDDIDTPWLERIETAYQHFPNQPMLQYLMGMACLKRQLWGKALQLLVQFTSAATSHTPARLRRNAWRAQALLAEHKDDTPAAQHAWKQAALVD